MAPKRSPDSAAARSGTQSVERAIRLLTELARRSTGWRLADLARECGLDPATTHRLLGCLADSGLVARRATDRHFVIGPELLNLGLAAGYHGSLVLAARNVAREVAAATRQVAFVYLRSGDDFTCVARGGRTAIQGLSVRVGTRRPLAASAGGAAMLLKLDEAERQRILAENLARVRSVGAGRARGIERMWKRSQQAGYGWNEQDVVPGLTAVSVAALLPAPWHLGSVLVTGPSAALDATAIAESVRVLEAAARSFEQRALALVAAGQASAARGRSSFEA